jgi:hypothetical protein
VIQRRAVATASAHLSPFIDTSSPQSVARFIVAGLELIGGSEDQTVKGAGCDENLHSATLSLPSTEIRRQMRYGVRTDSTAQNVQ